MASIVKEEHITNLRAAGYLAADIAHLLPDAGQVIPTLGPHERVVFVAQFVRGLGFPLHPFVRGLMFYYGLDFHDLAPNFVLNISAFIVVCEAFLRIRPHFGLWLQTFCVKPKVVRGQQAECGGAMVSRMLNVTWLDGSFAETVKGWQSGWFYIIEPRGANWAAAPEFRFRAPMRLTSWERKGLSWGDSTELAGLQTCVKSMKDKNIKLANVIQVMLVRRILPCQRRAFNLWLQIFYVKPKIVSGQQAECGGAMVGKMPNVTWLDGSFAETSHHRRAWQRPQAIPLIPADLQIGRQ